MRIACHVVVGLMVISCLTGQPACALAQGDKSKVRNADDAVLVRVDGQPIYRSDLDRMYKSRRVDPALQTKVRGEFLDLLIDTLLMQRFLKSQKIVVTDSELDAQVAQLKALLPKSATGQLDLREHGYTDKILRDELALPLMWRNYLSQTVTEKQLQDYFDEHRVELDGTEVRASQIFLKIPDPKDPEQVKQTLAKLGQIKQVIEDGLDFASAARKYSESPSREKGGDVGYFLTEGKMPRAFTKIAFALKPGEMSDPFVSPFGAHLCLVTDRRQGEHSLEDVRPKVMLAISNELRAKKMTELRAKAKIDILTKNS